MLVAENQIFRITYEAFSKFSKSLISCRSFDDVSACLKINLKYLFNFYFFRASYHWNHRYIHILVTPENTIIEVSETQAYLDYENALLSKGIPMHWAETDTAKLPVPHELPATESPELWGWNFKQADQRQITVSVLAGKSKPFTKKDITFLKLVAENLESKLLEICLFGELDQKNKELQDAFGTIKDKNAVITSIIEQQKEIISLRTQEIAVKNGQLLEISILNAHNVREPLSRILGLISILDYYQNADDIKTEIIPKLKKSSDDLDVALQDVIKKATSDLIDLKA